VHIAGHLRERGRDLGMERAPHVEDESPARIVIVGKEHAAGGHCILRVMDEPGRLVCNDGGHEATVGWRGRVSIDNSEKVIALVCGVAGPGKHVVPWGGGLLPLARGGQVTDEEGHDNGERNTRHVWFHLSEKDTSSVATSLED
jgi:hypothetical protein